MNRIPALHPQTAARTVEGQTVIIYSDSGDVNVLNGVGTRVWELIDGRRTVDEIVDLLALEYAVSRADAARDVDAFLADLLRRQAILLEERP